MADKLSILLVEDEKAIADILRLNLELEGYEVFFADSGNKALYQFKKNYNKLHLVLLDIMLPEINGYDLLVEFRKIKKNIPIIFITARGQSVDKIKGLKIGADDYVTKPFDLEELLLRIKNILKRNETAELNQYRFSGGTINFITFEATTYSGNKVPLSKRELGLLQLLTQNENKVVSRDEIINHLWTAQENPSSRTIDNFILNFRKYFELNPKEPKHFHSIRGVGYKFTP